MLLYILHNQEDPDIETTDKITIGGMRFSPEQVQITLSELLPEEDVLSRILHCLAEHHINLSFLCQDSVRGTHASFCLALADFPVAGELIDELLQPLKIRSEIVGSVGTLTLFPHKSRMKTLGLVLDVFGRNNLPIYAMSSSISALAVNTDYSCLDQAAEALETVFLLPENHSPFRRQLPGTIVD